MIALVSTTMCGSPVVRPRPPSGTGRRTIPIASAAMIRSSRFATVSPSIPSPRPSDTAERQPRPERVREGGERQAEQQPHQQAEEQADDGRDELGGRELLDLADQPDGRDDGEVREDREADDDPGDDPGDQEPAAAVRLLEQPGRRRQAEPDETAQRGAEEADVADHVVLASSLSRRRGPSPSNTPQPPYLSIGPIPPPRDRTAPDRCSAPRRSRRGGVPTAMISRPGTSGRRHRARRAGRSPGGSRAGRPRAAGDPGRSPRAARRAGRPRRSRRCPPRPAGRGATRRGRARAAGRGRARRRSGRRRG